MHSSLAARTTADLLQVAILTYKARATSTSDYLSDLISARTSETRMLMRNASRSLLAVPSTRTAIASRAFSVRTSGLEQSTRIHAIVRDCFKTFRTRSKTFKFNKALISHKTSCKAPLNFRTLWRYNKMHIAYLLTY